MQTHVPGNLADGKPASASSENPCCTATNVTDSNTGTYWESAAGLPSPQTLTVDLGAATSISKTTFKINPAWGGTRTENMEILGSTDGTHFSTLVPPADYTFDSATGNTVTVTFASATVRYVQVLVAGRTLAGQRRKSPNSRSTHNRRSARRLGMVPVRADRCTRRRRRKSASLLGRSHHPIEHASHLIQGQAVPG